jgi:hypothetical protein
MSDRQRLLAFLDDSLEYFEKKIALADRDRYFADRDIRSILDQTAVVTMPVIHATRNTRR